MNDSEDLFTGIFAGVLGGLVASFVMEGFQQLWATSAAAFPPAGEMPEMDEPATIMAADRVSQACLDVDVPKPYRPLAGAVMHYGLGSAVGGAYGAAALLAPPCTAGRGLAYGGLLWLALDEGLVPAAGLSKPWDQVPIRIHAFALISHLVFGLTLEATRTAMLVAPRSRRLRRQRA